MRPALKTSISMVASLGILILSGSEAEEKVRLIDLTHPFDQSTIYWPTNRSFRLDVVHQGLTDKGYWYETHDYSASEHGGTHIDAPVHFAKGKWTIDEIPLTHLVGSGIKVDVSAKAHPDYLISEQDLIAWEERHGRIPIGAIVLVHTGWEKFWLDKKRYLGSDKPGDTGDLHFPGFSQEAALFLTAKRTIHAVGLDTASLDHGQSKEFLAHRIFGEANIPGFENLRNLDLLPASGFRVLALPMKIGRGSGAPLRIIAETASQR
ncbi:MAG: cyclase family protein [Gammaproteobacteria bacterium]